MNHRLPALALLTLLCSTSLAATPPLDERPAAEGEWGYRPAPDESVSINPPRFSWRPQKSAASYTLEASRDPNFKTIDYTATDLEFNVHAPPKAFEPGDWSWRFRYTDRSGQSSPYSTPRSFHIPPTATIFPIPDRPTLLSRIPTAHPRLFLRPEQLPDLRRRAQSDLKPEFTRLLAQCDKYLKNPPKIEEPPTYPPGTVVKSEQWRTIWQRGMKDTPATLDPMVSLGLAYQLTGDPRYGDAGKRILLTVLKWDPHGSTGYRYNDEAGMPYNYLFARGYTFLHDLLAPAELRECQRVMRIRGQEMYNHLRPTHLWQPYESHRNRAWHFLGEVAISFHGEIPEADDWLWFSVNVFANTYPVWNDPDGGWHEGLAYWRTYMNRFSWWADAMRSALDLDAYQLPFFSQVGYFPIYLQPPGTQWGGFGDQNVALNSAGSASLMATFAAQARNSHWMWYAQNCASPQQGTGNRELGTSSPQPAAIQHQWEPSPYLAFLRAASYPKVDPKPPTDLPTSRCFHGIGQAFLNTTLLSARDNVEVLFKSSPFGTQSHGYNANNSFELYAHGLPLFLSTGQRDIYGSDHHANWMWETKSCNSLLVSNRGQLKHSRSAIGHITGFSTSPTLDWVRGDAADAYSPALKRFTRDILFAKPDLVVIYDRVESPTPETYQWLLHAQKPMTLAEGDHPSALTTNGDSSCQATFLYPANLKLTQTDRFSPPPRDRIKLTQYHLTAEIPSPSTRQEFIIVLRVGPAHAALPAPGTLTDIPGGGHQLTTTANGRPLTLRLTWDQDVQAESDGRPLLSLSSHLPAR